MVIHTRNAGSSTATRNPIASSQRRREVSSRSPATRTMNGNAREKSMRMVSAAKIATPAATPIAVREARLQVGSVTYVRMSARTQIEKHRAEREQYARRDGDNDPEQPLDIQRQHRSRQSSREVA